jgi:hypothetical protein
MNVNALQKTIPVVCVNCGKQNIVYEDDPYDVKCEFSGRDGIPAHPVRIKIKEGENMVADIIGKNLHPKTTVLRAELPPIPRKPGSKYKMRDYYDKNKDAILKYKDSIGLKETLKRWGISQATWLVNRKNGKVSGLAARFGLVPGVAPKSGVKRDRPRKKKKSGVKATKEPEDICSDCELLIQFRGYRMAVLDIFGGNK